MTIHSLVIQKLLSTNAHLGRRGATDHFKLFTYGIRNGMTVIDSDKTLICLRSAANFVSLLARQRANLLFVNSNPLFDDIIEQMSRRILGDAYSHNKATNLWRMSGFLTNSFSPKKFRSRNKKICFGPTTMPDCVVVFDTERKSSVVLEAYKLQIPIVALVDSNMPWEHFKKITYPVPANDSVQFVYLFCNMITKCFLAEQKKLDKGGRAARIEEELEEKKRKEEKMRELEQSKSKSEASFTKDEVLVVPYENLAAPSDDVAETKKILDKLAVVKFNRDLGTSMGFSGPRSMIEVCDQMTSLDLTVNQIEALNSKYGCNVPLILMNTGDTHEDTLKVLGKYYKSNVDIHPLTESQQSNEKSYGAQTSDAELNSSDHAAVFLSLVNGGTLDLLLSQGLEYALVVGANNVAAMIDPKILKHMVDNKIEYSMEVTPSNLFAAGKNTFDTQQEKFHLADITWNSAKHSQENFKFIDTRSLWIDLKATKRLSDTDELKVENLGISKGVDGEGALLEETAAGSAIQLFGRTLGVSVPRSRCLPVHGTSDLLLLRSDLYSCREGALVRNAARTNAVDPSIELGPEFQKVCDIQSRFKSIPSIIALDSLKVTGDVWFGAGITLKGNVSIAAKPGTRIELPDGLVLENKEINNPSDI